ncbi:transporter [uncultured Microscilla sp.]|uniref:transporter n=1 Tax=uncultured Microscilla sp. TaxID=432653 RepID=UPI002624CD42|nr:transporter [uncultured Microscilla sp.]
MNKIYLLFLLTLGIAVGAQAQTTSESRATNTVSPLLNDVWIAPKWHGYVQLSQTAIYAQQFYEAEGSVQDMTTAGFYSTELSGRLGLGSNLEVSLQAPLFVRATRNAVRFRSSQRVQAGDQVNTIGDMTVGVKYGLINRKSFVLSGSLLLGVPTGTTQGGESQLLQTGDGEFNQIIGLDIGYAISSFYVTGGVGFNNRTNSFSDEIRANAGIAWAYNRFLAMVQANMVHSLNNGTASATPENIFSNNVRYVTITPKLAFAITQKLTFNASVGAIVSGQNMLKAPVYNTGVLFQF